jgi:hypothetical protein
MVPISGSFALNRLTDNGRTFWHHTGDDPTKVSVEARNETGESSCSPASPEQGRLESPHSPTAHPFGGEYRLVRILGRLAAGVSGIM